MGEWNQFLFKKKTSLKSLSHLVHVWDWGAVSVVKKNCNYETKINNM